MPSGRWAGVRLAQLALTVLLVGCSNAPPRSHPLPSTTVVPPPSTTIAPPPASWLREGQKQLGIIYDAAPQVVEASGTGDLSALKVACDHFGSVIAAAKSALLPGPTAELDAAARAALFYLQSLADSCLRSATDPNKFLNVDEIATKAQIAQDALTRLNTLIDAFKPASPTIVDPCAAFVASGRSGSCDSSGHVTP